MHILKQQLHHAQPLAAVALPPTQPCLNSLRPFTNNQLLQPPITTHFPTSASQQHVPGLSTSFGQFAQNQPVADFGQFSGQQRPFIATNPSQLPCPTQIQSSVSSQNAISQSFSRLIDVLHSAHPSGSVPLQQKIPTLNPRAAFVDGLVDITSSIINSVWPNHSFSSKAKLLPIQRFVQEILRRSRTSFSTLQLALLYLLRIKNELPVFRERLNEKAQSADLGHLPSQQPNPFVTVFDLESFCPLSPVSPPPLDSANRSGFGTVDQQPSGSDIKGKNHPSLCGRRMFLAALVVAGKYLQDQTYSNRAWAKISGLSVDEINQNEREFLKVIEYRLHVNNETFVSWSHMLMTWANFNKTRRERAAILSGNFPNFVSLQNSTTQNASGSLSPPPASELSEPAQRKRQRTEYETETGMLSPEDNPQQQKQQHGKSMNMKSKITSLRVSETSYLPSPAEDSLSFAGSQQPVSVPVLDLSNINVLLQTLHKLQPEIRKRKRDDDDEICDEKRAIGNEYLFNLLSSKLNLGGSKSMDIPSWIASVQAATTASSEPANI